MTIQQPRPNTEIIDAGPSTFERVAAEAVANVLSGVGLGLLTGVLLWALGAAWATVGTWATASAIAWAGAINWLRFSQDEIANLLTFQQMGQEIAEQAATNSALAAENKLLTDQIAWLERRAKPVIRVNGRPLEPEADPAHKDAVTLIDKKYGHGIPVTARHMMKVGWSDDRYKAAFALLKEAGIVEVRGTQTRWQDHPSPAAACSVLSLSTPVVLSEPTSETRKSGASGA